MNELEKFRSKYGKANPEKFNEELIHIKGDEDIVQLMSEACKSLEIIKEIKFVNCFIENRNTVYKPPEKLPKKTDDKKEAVNIKKEKIEESRFKEIILIFDLIVGDERKREEKRILFPELIDDSYFIINGNRFFPIFQLVDSECYKTRNSITFKTLMMPDVIKYENTILVNTNGETFESKKLYLDLFKTKVPVFWYYYAKIGLDATFSYFNFIDYIDITLDEPDSDQETFMSFECCKKKIYLNVNREWFNTDIRQNSILISTLIESFTGINVKEIESIDYWQKKLGSNFSNTVNNYKEKGISILSSFERILDPTTKRIIRIEEENKKDTYAIVRWTVLNYQKLLRQDNNDLANKRLRVYEYLMYALIDKFSKGVYRILNKKTITIKTLHTIFSNIKEEFLIKAIVNNNLVRYMNNVNSIDLFTNVLKGSINGPQSSGKKVNLRNRTIHPSMLGKIDICSTSAGDPGTSFTLTPFCQLYNCFFTTEPNLNYNNEIEYEDMDIEYFNIDNFISNDEEDNEDEEE